MSFEVDFLAVGDGSRNGDAIALRYGNLVGPRDEQRVIVIDGGTSSGESLVQHIRTYYGTDTLDYVVSTHPDADHASGLTVVLEELRVRQLFMHQPWKHAERIRHLFTGDRLTVRGLGDKLERALQNAKDLEALAGRKRIPISERSLGPGLTMDRCSFSARVVGTTRPWCVTSGRHPKHV